MRKTSVSSEQMRYKIPGVTNRFFNVHKTLVAVCVLILVILILFLSSYFIISASITNELIPFIIFFCEVDDVSIIDEYSYSLGDEYRIYFAHYDERAYKNGVIDYSFYGPVVFDLSLSNAFDEYICCSFNFNGTKSGSKVYYREVDLEAGSPLTKELIDKILEENYFE